MLSFRKQDWILIVLCVLSFVTGALSFYVMVWLRPKRVKNHAIIGFSDRERKFYNGYFSLLSPVASLFWIVCASIDDSKALFQLSDSSERFFLTMLIIDFLNFILGVLSPSRFNIFTYSRSWVHFHIQLHYCVLALYHGAFSSFVIGASFLIYTVCMIYHTPAIFSIRKERLETEANWFWYRSESFTVKPYLEQISHASGFSVWESKLQSIYFFFLFPLFLILWLVRSQTADNGYVPFDQSVTWILCCLFVFDIFNAILSVCFLRIHFHVICYGRFWTHLGVLILITEEMLCCFKTGVSSYGVLALDFWTTLLVGLMFVFSLGLCYRVPTVFIVNKARLEIQKTLIINFNLYRNYVYWSSRIDRKNRKREEELQKKQELRSLILYQNTQQQQQPTAS